MEAGGGFVEDVEGAPVAGGALEFGGELDVLGFAAGKLSGGLSEAQIAETDLVPLRIARDCTDEEWRGSSGNS